ncbi:hypothetical protein ABVK25_001050 [Lepraria finkii]|uniref:Uncharacterized protein n=1 Tax=Lepraria finkii TaxID=1340010 RepID=A0ABR4BNJ4_9LECA
MTPAVESYGVGTLSRRRKSRFQVSDLCYSHPACSYRISLWELGLEENFNPSSISASAWNDSTVTKYFRGTQLRQLNHARTFNAKIPPSFPNDLFCLPLIYHPSKIET